MEPSDKGRDPPSRCSASPRPAGAKTPGSLPSFPCQMPSRISLPPCVFLRPFRAAPRAGSLVPVPEGTARRRAASGATGGLGGLLGALRVSISAPRSQPSAPSPLLPPFPVQKKGLPSHLDHSPHYLFFLSPLCSPGSQRGSGRRAARCRALTRGWMPARGPRR